MKIVYLESSALLQWLLSQKNGSEVRRLLDAAEIVLVSTLTVVEAERALVRGETEGSLREGDARRLRGLLRRVQAAWMRMSVSEEVLARASRPFPVEPLRTLDAIHLATALELTASFPDLKVLSFDRRVQENAEALGIA